MAVEMLRGPDHIASRRGVSVVVMPCASFLRRSAILDRAGDLNGEAARRIGMAERTATIEQSYALAKDVYASFGVDAGAALHRLARVPISLHCWQGDDVGGFKNTGSALGGGLAV